MPVHCICSNKHYIFLQQEAEKFIMEEIAKQQKDKLPEFAIKTQLLTRKAGEKERLDKAKEQMHFKHLLQSKREEDDQVHEKSTAATEGTIKPVVSDLLLHVNMDSNMDNFRNASLMRDLCHLLKNNQGSALNLFKLF